MHLDSRWTPENHLDSGGVHLEYVGQGKVLLFSFSISMLSIFGNVYCTLKALPNIITNSEHHPLFFLVKFPPISTFRSGQWTLKTVPNVVTNSEHHC